MSTAPLADTIARVRADVAALHAELVRYGLVVWTGGNVSGRVPDADLFVIKPSGVSYDELAPESMILCDLDGNVVPGSPGSERSPSSDTAAHAYVYRHLGCHSSRRQQLAGRMYARVYEAQEVQFSVQGRGRAAGDRVRSGGRGGRA